MDEYIEILRGDKVIALYDAKHYSGVLYVAQDSTLNPLEVNGLQGMSRHMLNKRNKGGEVLGILLNDDYTLSLVQQYTTVRREVEPSTN